MLSYTILFRSIALYDSKKWDRLKKITTYKSDYLLPA
jgi:hypothetical protein